MAASTVTKKGQELTLNVTKHSSCKCLTSELTAVVAANITTNRRAASVRKKAMSTSHMRNDSSSVQYGRMELDSHAGTIVLGSNALILQYTSRECDVSPYSDSYEPIRNVPIVKGATAVTSKMTGETFSIRSCC